MARTALARSDSGQFVSARRSAPRRSGGGTVVVRVPGSVKRRARAGVSRAARAAASEKHTMVALLAAAGLGFLKRNDTEIPHISALGVAGTLGAVAWAGGRFMKSKTLDHAATGLLSVAVYEYISDDSDDDDDDGGESSGGRRRRRPGRSVSGSIDERD